MTHFKKLIELLPPDYLGNHIIEFVSSIQASTNDQIVIHATRKLLDSGKSTDINFEDISRPKGLYGGQDFEENKFPRAVHHFKIFSNESDKARVIYSYKAKESISFLRVTKRKTSND